MVPFLSFNSSLHVVNTIGKKPNTSNTKNEHDFQCNWIISDRASFLLLIGKKISYFLEVYVSGKENKDVVCCE